MGAGSLVVIMIGDATDEPEADPAIRKEFKYLRRTGDKRGQPSLVDSATTEKPHVREYLIVAIGHPGIAGQIVLANPDEPVGMDGATSELRRFFQHDRLQAKFVGSQRPGQSGDAGAEDDDVVETAQRGHRLNSLRRGTRSARVTRFSAPRSAKLRAPLLPQQSPHQGRGRAG